MSDSTNKIDQSEDFLKFSVDGQEYEADIFEARDRLAKIDLKHRDDQWECYKCGGNFVKAPNDISTKCDLCGADEGEASRDEVWLDDVKAYMESLGLKRVSRNTAGWFYNLVVNRMEEIKKKSSQTPESPSGSTDSTPAAGAAEESTPISIS